MAKRETQYTAELVKGLRGIRAMVANIHGHRMQLPGIPDLYVIHKNFKGWLELKGKKTKVQTNQVQFMKREVECGGLAYVVRFDRGLEILDIYDESGEEYLTTSACDGTLGEIAARLLQTLKLESVKRGLL